MQDHQRRVRALEKNAQRGRKGIILVYALPDGTFVDHMRNPIQDIDEIRKAGELVIVVDEDDLTL